MFFVRENLILHRKKNPGTVHQVNYWQPVFHRDFLCTQIFLGSNWEPRACLHSSIIRNNHALPSVNVSNACYNSGRRTSPHLFVHIFSGKETDLKKLTSLVS